MPNQQVNWAELFECYLFFKKVNKTKFGKLWNSWPRAYFKNYNDKSFLVVWGSNLHLKLKQEF